MHYTVTVDTNALGTTTVAAVSFGPPGELLPLTIRPHRSDKPQHSVACNQPHWIDATGARNLTNRTAALLAQPPFCTGAAALTQLTLHECQHMGRWLKRSGHFKTWSCSLAFNLF
jgi:hypothetical protein